MQYVTQYLLPNCQNVKLCKCYSQAFAKQSAANITLYSIPASTSATASTTFQYIHLRQPESHQSRHQSTNYILTRLGKATEGLRVDKNNYHNNNDEIMTNLEELSWSCSTLSTDLWGFSPPRWSSLTGDTCSSFWEHDTITIKVQTGAVFQNLKSESLKRTTYLLSPPTSAPPKTCPEFPSGSDKMLCLSWTGTLCSSSSSWLLPR